MNIKTNKLIQGFYYASSCNGCVLGYGIGRIRLCDDNLDDGAQRLTI